MATAKKPAAGSGLSDTVPAAAEDASVVSDDEVQTVRQAVLDKQAELAELKLNLTQSESNRSNVADKAVLDAESNRLDQELNAMRAALQVSQEMPVVSTPTEVVVEESVADLVVVEPNGEEQ